MRPITNSRGQYCGYIDKGIYYTKRDKSKGEIFLKKRWFEGKYVHTPIAIDLYILDILLQNNIPKIIVTILNDGETRNLEFDTEYINQEGIMIRYDKRNVYGQNITGFGTQLVFDAENGRKIEPEQKKLI